MLLHAVWLFDDAFLPAIDRVLNPNAQANARAVQETLDRQRLPHAAWLDQPLAKAPARLARRDLFAGSWDQLIHEALTEEGEVTAVLPGWRYDMPLGPGDWIRREHLLMLSGSAEARLKRFRMSPAQMQQLLEQAAEQLWSTPQLLDNSEDLPRLLDCRYRLDYGQGPYVTRFDPPQGRLMDQAVECVTLVRSPTGEGAPLWQTLETYLRRQPEGWTLPQPAAPTVRFVEGHPGWVKGQRSPA